MDENIPSAGDVKPAPTANDAPPEAKKPDQTADGEAHSDDNGEPAAAPPEGQHGDDGRPRNKVPAKERISQLSAQVHSERRRADAAESKLRTLEQGLKPPPPNASLEEQEEFRLRKVVREERVDDARREAEEASASAARAVFNTFEAKAQEANDRFPGLVDKFLQLPVVSQYVAEFVADSDVGVEIAHHLAENPSEAERISRLPIFDQGKALARLEATVAKPTRRASNAPPPVPNTPGAPSTGGKTPETMNMREYASWAARRGKK